MRILFIAPRFPFPPQSGDSVVCYNRIRYLAESHQITLIAMTDVEPPASAVAEMGKYCKLIVVKRNRLEGLIGVLASVLVSNLPLQVAWFTSARLRKSVEAALSGDEFDLIHMIMYRLWSSLPAGTLPVLIDANDSQRLAIGHRVSRARGVKRWLLRMEEARCQRFEMSLVDPRIRVVVLSEADKASFPPGVATVIPMGVEIARSSTEKHRLPTLAFSGQLGYYPNEEAVLWFVENCWAAIRRQVADARLRIIGRNPPASLLALHGLDGVHVTGDVPSVAGELSQAWGAIAPMTVAWGMHTKVLEAMAAGTAVIASEAAGRTFGGASVAGMTIARDLDGFLDGALELLGSRDEAEARGSAAKAYVRTHYSWGAASGMVERLYGEMVR